MTRAPPPCALVTLGFAAENERSSFHSFDPPHQLIISFSIWIPHYRKGLPSLPEGYGVPLGRDLTPKEPKGRENEAVIMLARTAVPRGITARRRVSTLAVAVLSFLAVLLGPAASTSQAALLDTIVCTGTVTTEFDPGITTTPQQVHFEVDGQLTHCTSLLNPNLNLTGSFKSEGTGTFSCAASVTPFSQTINWSDKTSSTMSGTSVGPNLLGTGAYLATGTVTSGRFDGGTYSSAGVITPVGTPVDPGPCLQEGLTSRSGTIEVTIVDLGA